VLRTVLPLALALAATLAAANPTLQVGSKRFAESYILGEIVSAAARRAGEADVVHRQGLGNTAILLNALLSGQIDVYPEYTGTIALEILHLDRVPPLDELDRRLAPLGLTVAVPLGFQDGYALAVRADTARSHGVQRISELRGTDGLRFGLSSEFLGRQDGWPGLARTYGFEAIRPRAIEHGLGYEAMERGDIDVIDAYTTDAKLDRYGLRVLVDDAHYFPPYDAVLLARRDLPQRLPRTWHAISALQGRIDEATMRRLNAEAEIEQRAFADIAADWAHGIATRPHSASTDLARAFGAKLLTRESLRLAAEQAGLVVVALGASCAIGVPLGVAAARRRRVASIVFAVVGAIQTVPSLALLAFLVALTGRIGALPAFVALTLYALLPIVRNTHAGIVQVPRNLREAARALALPPRIALYRIELPLARPLILAGIKTSAVVNVGTATIAAFVGAGGLGERIVTGLALNDTATLLAGAVPVAAMALAIDAAFDRLERRLDAARAGRGETRSV